MNKIAFLIFTFMSFMPLIKADTQTFYSDYGEFSDYQEEFISSSDTILTEKERRYKLYKNVVNEGDYFIENENPTNLPFINKDDYKINNFTSWSTTKPEEKPHRIIDYRRLTYYQDMREIRYIHLYNFNGSENKLIIPEIVVYLNDEVKSYSVLCQKCSENFEENVKNKVYNDNVYVQNDGYIRLDLGYYYKLDAIKIKIYLYDPTDEEKRYSFNITRTASKDDQIFAQVVERTQFKSNDTNDVKSYFYNINDYNIINPEWWSMNTTTMEVLETKTRRVEVYDQYRYQDTLYRYYNMYQEKTDDYFKDVTEEYPYKCEDEYKDYYRYKTRDKLVLKNDMVITSYEDKLEDFIVYQSKDVIITGEVNYDINDTYNVIYKMGEVEVSKDVVVNIERKSDDPKLEDDNKDEEVSKPEDSSDKEDVKPEDNIDKEEDVKPEDNVDKEDIKPEDNNKNEEISKPQDKTNEENKSNLESSNIEKIEKKKTTVLKNNIKEDNSSNIKNNNLVTKEVKNNNKESNEIKVPSKKNVEKISNDKKNLKAKGDNIYKFSIITTILFGGLFLLSMGLNLIKKKMSY